MDIQKSIVAILDRKKKIIGTGFVAGENLILTCAHVVETATASVVDPTTDLNVQVTIRFAVDGSEVVAQVDAQSCSPSYEKDVALLRVDNLPQGAKPLPLAPAAGSAGHDFYAYGYATVTNVQGIGARGKIVDIVDNGRLVQLTSQEPDHGMSGGPVLDDQRHVVIGIVTKGKGLLEKDQNLRNTQTTFATSTQVIFEVCHELKPTEICPYRSLDAFNEEDATFFFGRERLVTKLLESLKREPRFLAVLGPSGSGKSSVVRAGLIPALRQGKVSNSQKWGIVTIRPANQPFEQLADAGFINPQIGLENAVKTWLADRPDIPRLMLVIDQFEEVLVITPSNIRKKFIAELVQLLDAPIAITVVVTLRDDFYSQFLSSAVMLTGLFERSLVNTPAVLEQDELKAMVFEPAKSVGLTFDDGLVDIIVADTFETDHSTGVASSKILPLLEFALTQLWELRKDGRLTHEAYKNIGGTTGGLSQWADQIYYELSPKERKLAEQAFCSLVHLGDTKEKIPDTRRIIPIRDLLVNKDKGNLEQVIHKLVQARLLSVYREHKTSQQYIEIIHDALLTEWKLLKNWIDKFRHRDLRARIQRRIFIVVGLILGLFTIIALTLVVFNQSGSVTSSQRSAVAANTSALAQAIFNTKDSREETAVLLAIESMRLSPTIDVAQVLQNHTLGHQIAQMKHPTRIISIKVSQDGRYIVSGCDDKVVRIWDIATGKEIAEMKHQSWVSSVAISSDGQYVVSGSDDGIARVWSVATQSEIARINHDDTVTFVAFIDHTPLSKSGRYVVSGSIDGTIRVWDTTTSEEINHIASYQKIPDYSTSSYALSQDGKYIILGSESKTAQVWELATGNLMTQITHQTPVTVVAFSPDGKSIFSSGPYGGEQVSDAFTGESLMGFREEEAIISVAFSPDSKYIAVGNQTLVGNNPDKSARVWNLTNWQAVAHMDHDKPVNSVAFSPDGKYVVSGSDDGTARVWERATGLEIARMTHVGKVNFVTFSPDGKYVISAGDDNIIRVWSTIPPIIRMEPTGNVYAMNLSQDSKYIVSGGYDFNVRIWDLAAGHQIISMKHDDAVQSVVFSPDRKYVASGSLDATARVWNVDTGLEIARMTHTKHVNSVAFSPNGKSVLSGSTDGTARIWNATTGKEIIRITHGNEIDLVAFSADGKYFLSTGFDDVRVWDSATGQQIAQMKSDQPIASVAFSPDGKYIVTGSSGNIMRVWNLVTGQDVLQMAHDANENVGVIAFSPDGKYIISGSSDKTARVWDAATGHEIARMLHDDSVLFVAFSSDSKYAVSGSSDKVVRVWDAKTGQEFVNVTYDTFVRAVAFSKDGKYIVSATADGPIVASLYRPEDLIAEACSRVTRNLTRAEWQQYTGDMLPYQAICSNLPTGP